MRKLFALSLFLLSMLFVQLPAADAIRIWWATSLTGGVEGSLDNVDGDPTSDQILPVNGDVAGVINPTIGDVSFYYLNGSSGASESSPNVIQPDDEVTGNKRWILVKSLTLESGGGILTGKTASDTLSLKAWDTDGTDYTAFITMTAGPSPAMAISNLSSIDLDDVDDYKVNTADLDRAVLHQGQTVSAGAANQTFGPDDGRIFIVDPEGGAINFDPSGTFDTFHEVIVINAADAAENIVFDSSGLSATLSQNERGIFIYSGSAWLKVYEGS